MKSLFAVLAILGLTAFAPLEARVCTRGGSNALVIDKIADSGDGK